MAEPVKVRNLRALDALVAEHVFGHEIDAQTGSARHSTLGWYQLDAWRPSESAAAAWEVDERARADGRIARTVVVVTETGENFVTLYPANGSGRFYVSGGQRTLPLALCLAHLRAVGVEVELAIEPDQQSQESAGR